MIVNGKRLEMLLDAKWDEVFETIVNRSGTPDGKGVEITFNSAELEFFDRHAGSMSAFRIAIEIATAIELKTGKRPETVTGTFDGTTYRS